MKRRYSPTVNAGSMADIAFLLLIFFLVTTTISAEKGILRKLPSECPPGQICEAELHERNVLRIFINANDDIMIEDEEVQLEDIAPLAKAFLDNNGDGSCLYCSGLQSPDASDNPKEAVISLQHDATTSYSRFIEVQDELTKAYFGLREVYARKTFDKAPENLSDDELLQTKKAYPFILSEAKTKRE
ncbi:biopolymer transporter ExbD [Winogradskyella maritima]|uniref:ExbD/TolR family protein n=1 Tax=Winogradskyella maritima TaxID=1517766 RepID=A0ABV8AMK5_9FLAO|nr:biopolymer transporter ExbD [Winogradskyella maritima]